MRTFLIVIAGLLLPILAPLPCAGAHISLEIKPASVFSKGKVRIKTDVTNKGDEPAMTVWIEAGVGGSFSKGETKEYLEVNETFHSDLEIGDAPHPPGIYTVIIRVHYTDANGYPFDALSTIPLVTGEPVQRKEQLTASLSSVEIKKDGEVVLVLNSHSDEPIVARVELVLPDHLEYSAPVLNLAVLPREEKTIRFKIHNLSALAGSTYSIFAVIDYLWDGQHHSTIASAGAAIMNPWAFPSFNRMWWLIVIIPLLLVFAILQFSHSRGQPPLPASICARLSVRNLFPFLILAILLCFTLYHIPPSYLILDTLTVGGDMPAHNYLASHLKKQLFGHGRIVSWAPGWWCGFPMFQFYFCLPYLLVAVLSFAVPFNIAFKMVSVLGILSLPAAAFVSGRIMRLPRPGPVLLAIAMIPLLFDRSHTIWGVNIYSTLAGMISNSLSFPIMLIFIASACRDSDDGQFRLRTVFLFTALIASHFFTSIVAGLTIAVLPFLRPRKEMRKALTVLAKECALAFLLMAWWLLPLVAKRAYSVDFGVNWDICFHESLPAFTLWLLPFTALSAVLPGVRRLRFVAVTCWMLTIAVLLFYFGYDLSHVFVNVRLWPFIIYCLLAMPAVGIGLLIRKLRANELAVAAILIITLVFGIGAPNHVRNWARWNYTGLENKARWPVFQELTGLLQGTPGRLANDLHDHNNSFGSDRIFECVPHVIGKPILEGGIVNSALGSMFSYYIQGETSKNCAGFPSIVTPAGFNFADATKHLTLFNVKHFIARWSKTKTALARSEDWRLVRESRGWELYELLTHDGSYVFIPEKDPIAVEVGHGKKAWKKDALEWMYTIEAIDQPFVFLRPGEKASRRFETTISEKAFLKYLSIVDPVKTTSSSRTPLSRIINEEITDTTIRFRTKALGLPHIIKCSYYPNWKVRGAEKVYMVTPCFMLVYPQQEEVELYYGYTLSDNIGRGLTLLGLVILALTVLPLGQKGTKQRQERPQRRDFNAIPAVIDEHPHHNTEDH